jgi:hypothetical protein
LNYIPKRKKEKRNSFFFGKILKIFKNKFLNEKTGQRAD